jgi:hypothetical protein
MIGSEPVAAVGSLKGAYRVRFDAWEASSALSMTAASAAQALQRPFFGDLPTGRLTERFRVPFLRLRTLATGVSDSPEASGSGWLWRA